MVKPDLPAFPLPEGCANADDALRRKAEWMLKDAGQDANDEYVSRLNKELDIIAERGFANYLLIISDVCEAVWERGGIVGPGRGSACGLLVNYLLGITEVDPVRYGLLAERAISYNPSVMLDIGLDLDVKGQEIAFRYMAEKYGTDHVARIAKRQDSSNSGISIKKGGLLLGRKAISDYAPTTLMRDEETGEDHIVSQYEPRHDGDMGPVEFDFIWQEDLSVSILCQDDVESDDPETYRLFCDADTDAIPWFESEDMKRYLKELQPGRFEQLVALYALNRPGLDAMIPEYIARRKGIRRRKCIVIPGTEDILEETYGMMIYQEQLMAISARVAGFNLEEQNRLRKVAGKFRIRSLVDGKYVEFLPLLRERFIGRGAANGYDRAILERFWGKVVCGGTAAYLFMKSHAVAYVMTSWRCANVKAHGYDK